MAIIHPTRCVCSLLAALLVTGMLPPAVLAAEPIDTFQAKLAAMAAIVEAADNDAWVALFDADAVVMPPNNKPVRGRDAIHALYAPAYSGYADISVDYQLEAVDREGDLAVMRYSGAALLTRESGESYRTSTYYVDVLRRQPDGSWLITLHAWSRQANASN